MDKELADMTIVTRPFAMAIFKYEDRIGCANVTIGDAHVEPLLGMTALEALNVSVDPISHTLVKNRLVKLK